MRHQDRLLRSLAHPDPVYRAYVARQLESLVIHFDSEDLLETVRGLWRLGNDPLAAHFLCAYNELFPRHLRVHYDPQREVLRSGLISRRATPVAAPHRAEERQELSKSATQLLDPVLLALLARAGTCRGRERPFLLATLARFRHGEVERFLFERLADDAEGPFAALLLTACLGSRNEDRILGRVRDRVAADSFPHYLLALRYLPSEWALELLEKAPQHRAPGAQWVAAACLDHYGRFSWGPLMTRLLDGPGWAAAHALESLCRLDAGVAAWPHVARVLASTDQPLVRSAALKAAASVGGPEALEACLSEVRSPHSNYSQVQAVVSLLMMEAPADVRGPVLWALARSSRLDVATQAILGLVGGDDRRAGLSIRDWLLDGSDEARVQAAYCLGYHQGRSAVRVLENLVLKDPCPAVRQQALRALAYYDRTPEVNGVLLPFLGLPDERLAIDAVRILAASDNSGDSEIARALAGVLGSAQPGPLRLAACRALGRFSDSATRALLQQLLGETAGSPGLLRAAIDAVGVSAGGAPELRALKTLLGHSQPEVRAAAARVLYRWGELDGLPALAEMVAGTDVELREALAALEEIAFITDHLALEPGFKALAARLEGNLASPEFGSFSAWVLGSAVMPIIARGAADPHQPVLGRVSFVEEALGGGEPNQVVAAVETARLRLQARPVPRLQPAEQMPEMPSVSGLDAPPRASRARLLAAAGGVALLLVVAAAATLLPGREAGPTAEPAAGQASPAPAAGLESRPMAVLEVSGTVLLAGGPGTPATPAVAGRPVTAGQRVEAGKGASVRLGMGASNNTVSLKGEGALEIEAIEADPADPTVQRLKLGGFAGRLVFNFKWGRPRVDATAGGLSFHGLRGLYGIESRPGGGVLRVASGRIEVKGSGDYLMLVSGGQKFVYTVASGRGELEPYDEKDDPLD